MSWLHQLTFLQAAVAKFVGLLTLRLADSIIIPLNTTYYTLELSNYVKKYVSKRVPFFGMVNNGFV